MGPNKNRRKIVRRKPGTKSSGEYFSQETQDAIVEYQKEKIILKKQEIYMEKIFPAFDHLVENLINVYTFKIMHETKKDLKTECMEFLFTTVEKFNADKGSKAFSYFNVVAKNWLTIKSKQNAKKVKTYISADDKENFSDADLEQMESHNVVPSYEDMVQNLENANNLKKVLLSLKKKVKTENEILCVQAIDEIVNNIDNLDIFNKKAILLYIRNISGLSSKQLSSVMANLKKHYKEIKKEIHSE